MRERTYRGTTFGFEAVLRFGKVFFTIHVLRHDVVHISCAAVDGDSFTALLPDDIGCGPHADAPVVTIFHVFGPRCLSGDCPEVLATH